eukprot:12411651-Alexandrium_andersonii.AAC.1
MSAASPGIGAGAASGSRTARPHLRLGALACDLLSTYAGGEATASRQRRAAELALGAVLDAEDRRIVVLVQARQL